MQNAGGLGAVQGTDFDKMFMGALDTKNNEMLNPLNGLVESLNNNPNQTNVTNAVNNVNPIRNNGMGLPILIILSVTL
jgi:hypothetical protein